MTTATPSHSTADATAAEVPIRVLSCMQPTGDVHLGSYLGALRQWVRGQHDKDVFHGKFVSLIAERMSA